MSATTQTNQPSGSVSSRLPFLAFVSDTASVETLRQFAIDQQWPANLVHEGDIAAATVFLKNNPSPEVLLVEIASSQDAAAALDALADVCDPNVKVVVTGSINEYSFYCWLTEMGISSYLLKPITLPAMENAYKKALQPQGAVEPKQQKGQIIAGLGTRGGVGTSTLLAHLADIIAQSSQKPTALLDLDPQLGTAALMFDLDPGRGLREALEKPDRIDAMFLERVMIKPNPTLSLISTEEGLEETAQYNEQAADALLDETQRNFAYVFVDVPRLFNSFTRRLLAKADQVLLVTDMSMAGLRDAIRIHDLFKDKLHIKPPLTISNGAGLSSKHEISQADFEKGLKAKIAHAIPFSYDLYAAGSFGELLNPKKTKDSPDRLALQALAHSIAPRVKTGVIPKHKAKLSFTGFWKAK